MDFRVNEWAKIGAHTMDRAASKCVCACFRVPIRATLAGIWNLEHFEKFSSIRYSVTLSTLGVLTYLNPVGWPALLVGIVHKSIYVLYSLVNSAIQIEHSYPLTVIIRLFLLVFFFFFFRRWWQKATMADKNLYCSQYKDVDRSTLGTSTIRDENGATVRRSTREKAQWVPFCCCSGTVYEFDFKSN